MDRRNFLHGALCSAALSFAKSTPASRPGAMASTPRIQLLSSEERHVGLSGRAVPDLALQEPITLWSGLRDLDQLTNGLRPGSLIVVASRPSLGKSQLVFQIADHIAGFQRRAVIISCARDGATTVAKRLIGLRAGVDVIAVIRGWPLDADAQRRVQSASIQFHTIPILLDDTPFLTANQIVD